MVQHSGLLVNNIKNHYLNCFFHEIIGKIKAAMEKYDEIDLSTIAIIFKFIDIPTGGSGTTSRDKSSILNK